MISKITGTLDSVDQGRAMLTCGHVTYELLITAVDTQRLQAQQGEEIEFHTLHYLEAQSQGSSFVPRLVGFAAASDRSFFELFTTVKGVGTRRALRSLVVPVDQIAAAIAEKDIKFLITLPEIGKRTAESIVAELHGRVDVHLPEPNTTDKGAQVAARDAITMLCQLGESRPQARRLVAAALEDDPSLDSADRLVAAACQIKEHA